MHGVYAANADFTGISAPYEPPTKPEIHIKTDQTEVFDGVKQMVAYLQGNGFL
jgi:adenylylsulfate kinase